MRAYRKAVLGILFSVASSLAGMAVMSRIPGLDIPLPYWIFGFMAPLCISTPVCLILTRQAEQNRRLNTELHAAMARLQRLSEIDQMTGLLNRASFLDRLDRQRIDRPGLCLLIDVDHFKAINDRHGHAAGDRTLSAIARALTGAIRSEDLCGRLGGEEFAIHLGGIDAGAGAALAERIRQAVEAIVVTAPDGGIIRPTISIGCAHATTSDSADALLCLADRAMYQAKAAGRNQVRLAA